MLRNVIIVLLSFGASAGFGVVFGIETKRLPLAGLCGAISRIVLITCQSFIPNRVAYLFLSALAAGLLADLLEGKAPASPHIIRIKPKFIERIKK